MLRTAAILALLVLAGCATAPPSPEYLAARQVCGQETLRAMQSGLSDNVAGAVEQQCMAAKGFPWHYDLWGRETDVP